MQNKKSNLGDFRYDRHRSYKYYRNRFGYENNALRGLQFMNRAVKRLQPRHRQFHYDYYNRLLVGSLASQCKRVTDYYRGLLYPNLRKYLLSFDGYSTIIEGFFRTLDSGDYTYYIINGDTYYNGKRIVRKVSQDLVPENYSNVANAIANAILREYVDGNYGQVFSPKYPYYFQDKNGVQYLFPSKPIINCLYTNTQMQDIKHYFNQYFSEPPNFGAAYYCVKHNIKLRQLDNPQQYEVQFKKGRTYLVNTYSYAADFPKDSPCYGLYVASDYNYNFPYGFMDKMLDLIYSSERYNFKSLGVKQRLNQGKELLPGNYSAKQISYLVRPFMYSYFQPNVPLYKSFTNYMALHHGKWPDKDIRQVLQHFTQMSSHRNEIDEEDGSVYTVDQLSNNQPLLGTMTDAEYEYHQHHKVFNPDLIKDDDWFDNAFQQEELPRYVPDAGGDDNIYSGLKPGQIPQAYPAQSSKYMDIRRLPNDQNY